MPDSYLGVDVQIFDQSETLIRQRKGNQHNPEFRAWVSRVIGWAMAENHYAIIERIPEETKS